jgi:hypothetical protein
MINSQESEAENIPAGPKELMEQARTIKREYRESKCTCQLPITFSFPGIPFLVLAKLIFISIR